MDRLGKILHKNKKLIWSGFTVCLLLILFGLLSLKIRQDRVEEQVQSRVTEFPAEYDMYEMPDQMTVIQSFRPRYAKLDSLDIYLANIEAKENGYLDLLLREAEGKELFHRQIPLSEIKAGDYFSIAVNLTLETDREYAVEMYTMGADTLVPVMLGMPAEEDVEDNTSLMLDYQESETGLVIGYTYSHLTYLGYEEKETALVVKYRTLAAAAQLLLCAALLIFCIYKKPSRYLMTAAECALLLLFLETVFSYQIRNGAGEDERITDYYIQTETDYMQAAGEEGAMIQTFTSNLPLDGIEIYIRNETKMDYQAFILLTNAETGEVVCRKNFQYDPDYREQGYRRFTFQRYNPERRQLTYELTVQKISGKGGLEVFGSLSNAYPNGALNIGGREQAGDLAFRLLSESASPNVVKWCMVLFVFLFAIWGFSILITMVFRWRTEWIFGALAALFGAVYLFILPPNSAPDTYAHTMSAYHCSNRMMGIRDDLPNGRIQMRGEDVFLQSFIGKEIGLTDYQKAAYFAGHQERDKALTETPARTNATGMLLPYLPAAVGITAGRLLGLNSMWVVYLGEIMNLGIYIFLFGLAIRRIPFGKTAMAVMGLCPMALHLAASFSYDPVQIGVVGLYIAYCLELAYGPGEKIEKKDAAVLAALFVSLFLLKIVYVVLGALLLLIPAEKWRRRVGRKKRDPWSKKKKWLLFGGAGLILAVTLTGTVWKLVASGALTGGNQVLVDGDLVTTYSVAQFLSHPLQMIALFGNTLFRRIVYYCMTMFGSQLGWLNVNLQEFLIWGFLILFLLSAARMEKNKEPVKGRDKAVIAVCVLMTVFLVMLSMLFNFTFSGSPVIEGVQGRYFLPLLPLLPCLMANLKWLRVRIRRETALHLAVLLEILAVADVLGITLMR